MPATFQWFWLPTFHATYYLTSSLPSPNHFNVYQDNSIPVKMEAAQSSKMSLPAYDDTQF
jgi:hypothetical protein